MIVALFSMSLAIADDSVRSHRLQSAVSTSRGQRGGVTVFWPRVIPATTDAEMAGVAPRLQQRLEAIVRRADPTRELDTRPAPQRVCDRERGCRSTRVGVLIGHDSGGCVAVGLLGAPGTGPLELLPLAGTVELSSTVVPFRTPPEDFVVVKEFVRCSELVDRIDDTVLVERLRDILRGQ